MRIRFVLLPLSLLAAPAMGQSAPPPMPIPQTIADPASISRMTNVLDALSRSLLSVPVGEIRAAAEGRPATPADRADTIGSETGVTPGELHARVQSVRPMVQQGAQAMARALPKILQTVGEVQGSLDRAIANMPDPNYPRR